MRARVQRSVLVTLIAMTGLLAWPLSAASAGGHHHRRDHRVTNSGPATSTAAPNGSNIPLVVFHLEDAINIEKAAQKHPDEFKRLIGNARRALDEALTDLSRAENDGAIAADIAARVRSNIDTALDLDLKAKKAGPGPKANDLLSKAIALKQLALGELPSLQPQPTPTNAGGPKCDVMPNDVQLLLNGSFAASVTCIGFPPAITADAFSPGLQGACLGGVDFNGLTPPTIVASDANGRIAFRVFAAGCVPGKFIIEVTEGASPFMTVTTMLNAHF